MTTYDKYLTNSVVAYCLLSTVVADSHEKRKEAAPEREGSRSVANA